jgi:hypothetical protein
MTSIEQIFSRLEHHGARLERKPEGGVRVKAPSPLPDDLLEVIRVNKAALIEHMTERPEPRDTGTTSRNLPGSLERLPHELEALIRAATNNSLPAGTVTLESGLCADLSRYVLAWGCAYLLHSPDALGRLWTAWKAWRGHLAKVLN